VSSCLLLSRYEGVGECLTPYKGSYDALAPAQRDLNHLINSNRVGVENAYGRMKNLFQVAAAPYRGDHNDVHDIAWACANLTNLDILQRPLRRYFSRSIFA